MAAVGTQKFHEFIPLTKDYIQIKTYSFPDNTETHKVQVGPDDEGVLFEEKFGGKGTCAYENKWHVLFKRPS